MKEYEISLRGQFLPPAVDRLPFALGRFQKNSGSIQFLHPSLWNFWLPLFFALTGLSLLHEVFKLKIGNWTPALTLTNVILGIVSIVYIIGLVTTQQVINPAFLSMLDNTGGARNLGETVEWGIYIWDMVNSIWLAGQLNKIIN